MLRYCFTFDHVSYARNMSFQHVFLRDLERKNHPAIADLKQKGFGGSLSGNKFSSIHGDLITEIFNGETKRNSGPFRAGYGSDPMKMNARIKTSHLHARLQSALKKLT